MLKADGDYLGGLRFNRSNEIAAPSRGLLVEADQGMAFVIGTSWATEFALARWPVGGAMEALLRMQPGHQAG